jgi:methylated-DNA-[protein]-cysteine S-methyltransferase
MLIVPCHRVVAADGIGSYGSAGIRVKRRLLGLEGVEL